MNRDEIVEKLLQQNPKAGSDKIAMYADAFLTYKEANDNIQKNGAICAHPKTGAPIDNPYLRVRQQMQSVLAKIKLKTDGLW